MNKFILSIAIILSMPLVASAAFNDVSLTTSAVISVAGVDYSVYSSTALLQSITVGASSFDVTMAAGSSLTIYSATNKTFTTTSDPSVTITSSCAGAYSTLALTATGVATMTITPSGTCTYGGGSGGGGGGAPAPTPAPEPTPTPPAATTTATSTPITATTTLVHGPLLTKTLQLGSTDSEVILLQQFLVLRGHLTLQSTIPLGYFGALTVDAVKKFQASVGLDQVGFVGPKTRDTIYATMTLVTTQSSSIPVGFLFTRSIKIGSSGADVAALQQILIAKGFLVFNAKSTPGFFGGLSKTAVIKFQKSLGLEPVGVVGPMTRKALNKITGAI